MNRSYPAASELPLLGAFAWGVRQEKRSLSSIYVDWSVGVSDMQLPAQLVSISLTLSVSALNCSV